MPFRPWPLLLAGLAAIGCSEELGPERFPTTKVRGVVTIGGRRMGGGFLSFDPAGGTRGNPRVARVRTDGTFEADGVPVGRVIVRVDQIPVESIPTASGAIPARQLELRLSRSPIRRTVPEGGTRACRST